MYDFFISFKCTYNQQLTRDRDVAREIYDELTKRGAEVFYSDEELQKHGTAKYMQEINDALRSASVFILVASNPVFLKEGWVAQEWSSYLNLMMSDNTRKIFTVLIGLTESDLPALLGPFQSFHYERGVGEMIAYLMQTCTEKKSETPENTLRKCVDSAFALSGWKNEEYLMSHMDALEGACPEMAHYLIAYQQMESQNYSQAVPVLGKLLEEHSVLGAYLMGKAVKKGYGSGEGTLREAGKVLRDGRTYWLDFLSGRSRCQDGVLLLVYEKNEEMVTSAEYMAAAIYRIAQCYDIHCEIASLSDRDPDGLSRKLGQYAQILFVTDDINCFFPREQQGEEILSVLSRQDPDRFSIGLNSIRTVNLPKAFRKYPAYELQRQGIGRYCRHLLQGKFENGVKEGAGFGG